LISMRANLRSRRAMSASAVILNSLCYEIEKAGPTARTVKRRKIQAAKKGASDIKGAK
jgi:hypothetical protein